ncbi:MAG: hypothetical protein U0Z44_06165 [Kouleothrix sp.]
MYSAAIAPGEFISLIGPWLRQEHAHAPDPATSRAAQQRRHPGSRARRLSAPRIDRDYGIVFQAPVLYDWRTVRKNVELPLAG